MNIEKLKLIKILFLDVKERKRKKKPAKIVTFDDDELSSLSASPASSVVSPISTYSSTTYSGSSSAFSSGSTSDPTRSEHRSIATSETSKMRDVTSGAPSNEPHSTGVANVYIYPSDANPTRDSLSITTSDVSKMRNVTSGAPSNEVHSARPSNIYPSDAIASRDLARKPSNASLVTTYEQSLFYTDVLAPLPAATRTSERSASSSSHGFTSNDSSPELNVANGFDQGPVTLSKTFNDNFDIYSSKTNVNRNLKSVETIRANDRVLSSSALDSQVGVLTSKTGDSMTDISLPREGSSASLAIHIKEKVGCDLVHSSSFTSNTSARSSCSPADQLYVFAWLVFLYDTMLLKCL